VWSGFRKEKIYQENSTIERIACLSQDKSGATQSILPAAKESRSTTHFLPSLDLV